MAESIQDAIKKEHRAQITDIYMDEDWKKDKLVKSEKVGFK